MSRHRTSAVPWRRTCPARRCDKPLVVLTAGSGNDAAWAAAQNNLATLSTNSAHGVIDGTAGAAGDIGRRWQQDGAGDPLRLDAGGREVLRRCRPGEGETLGEVASEVAQHGQRFEVLDPFGGHEQVQVVSEIDGAA